MSHTCTITLVYSGQAYMNWFSSTYVYTAEPLLWLGRPTSVRRLLTQVSLSWVEKCPRQILWKATCTPYVRNILFSSFFFQNFNLQIFTISFLFSLTWDYMGTKNSKHYCTSPTVSVQFEPNFMITILVTREYGPLLLILQRSMQPSL